MATELSGALSDRNTFFFVIMGTARNISGGGRASFPREELPENSLTI
jgi:hypothetical protein